MAKAMRRIGEYLSLIDIVIEVVDARVPRSGRNPMLDKLIARRSRIVALTRNDLADPATTRAWIHWFAQHDLEALAVDGRAQPSVGHVAAVVARLAKARGKPSRTMVVGIPNSGKSSVINGLLRRAVAKTEDRAGVTRQLQWFRLSPDVEVMDTPGILVPKIASKESQWKLAVCGAVPRSRYDPEEVSDSFHRWLLLQDPATQIPDLAAFAATRGFVRRGGEIDHHNAAQSYLRALTEGEFGRISLEAPDDAAAA